MTISDAIRLTEAQETGGEDQELPEWVINLATDHSLLEGDD